MKIAIVCDWLVHPGGAEKVLAELISCYPHADLYAIVDFLPSHLRHFLQKKPVVTSFLQNIPFAKSYYRNLLPFMPLAIEQFDFTPYDVVISTSHAVAKGIITGPNQLHISYVYTPMRYAWDLQHQYLRETGLDKKMAGWVTRYLLHKLRLWDYRSAAGVDHFIAISHYIAKRVMKCYRREASVIYPPVDLSRFRPGHHKDNFYMTASRLVPYKQIALIVAAFNSLPDKELIVIGDGPEFKRIQKLAGPNVKMLGYQKDAVMCDYLQRARAFIFAAEEDFGLLPVEAQASGTPVIAYAKGGVLETVVDQKHTNPTGHFFYKQTALDISEGILQFEANIDSYQPENCVQQASRFAAPKFRTAFKSLVNELYENR